MNQRYSKSKHGLSPACPSRTVLKKDKSESTAAKAKAKSEAKPKIRKGEDGDGGKRPKKKTRAAK